MKKSNTELMCLYWTSAGYFPDESEISRFPFKDRVEAAAKAGFKGIGIWHADLEHTLQKMSLKEMKNIMDGNGIKYLEVEFLLNWFLDGEKRKESDIQRKRLLEASQALNAKHVKVGDFYNSTTPMSRLIEEFAQLCQDAKEYEAIIGFEVMGSSMVTTLKDAMEMILGAGADNGGIIIDILQQVNLGMTFDEISRIPLKHMICVELNDGPEGPAGRKYCGEGEYDVKGLIKCLRDMNYAGPWALEVINREYAKLPLDTMCKKAYETTMAVFAECE